MWYEVNIAEKTGTLSESGTVTVVGWIHCPDYDYAAANEEHSVCSFSIPASLLNPKNEEEQALLCGLMVLAALRDAPTVWVRTDTKSVKDWIEWMYTDLEIPAQVYLMPAGKPRVEFVWREWGGLEALTQQAQAWQTRQGLMELPKQHAEEERIAKPKLKL